MLHTHTHLPLVPMTPIFKWHEDRCGSMNWHQKNMCLKDIIGSIVNIFGGRGYMNT